MKLARVTGTVTGTVKDSQLTGQKMLLVDIVDAGGTVLEPSVVALDVCSAGPGDHVVVSTGSAARLPAQTSGVPTDATVVAIIDEITVDGKTVYSSS
ncbi:MAG: EutN/CcmL family microcompartment protein [Pseudomonadota bacterium]